MNIKKHRIKLQEKNKRKQRMKRRQEINNMHIKLVIKFDFHSFKIIIMSFMIE